MRHRCVVEMSLHGDGWGLNLGPGQVVDLDAIVGPGVRLGEAIAGREECFEPDEPVPTAPPQPDVADDVKES